MTQSLPDSCFGPPSSTLRLANEFLHSHSLSEILPYRSFDPETQLFINRSSLGFVIEVLPLVGCGEEVPRQLTGIFQHSLPLGSNLQCLLIASSRIDPWLKVWEYPRVGHAMGLEDLAKERTTYLRELSKDQGIRTFRLYISYSEPHSSSARGQAFGSMEEVLALREQLVTTLKGWRLPTKVWKAEDLISGLDELLNPSDALLHALYWHLPSSQRSMKLYVPSYIREYIA